MLKKNKKSLRQKINFKLFHYLNKLAYILNIMMKLQKYFKENSQFKGGSYYKDWGCQRRRKELVYVNIRRGEGGMLVNLW